MMVGMRGSDFLHRGDAPAPQTKALQTKRFTAGTVRSAHPRSLGALLSMPPTATPDAPLRRNRWATSLARASLQRALSRGFTALVLGVFLSVIMATPASAANLEENQTECTVPCEKTFVFNPDPGIVYDLAWDPEVPLNAAPRRVVTTTCSTEQPEGCRLTWRYETVGSKQVYVLGA